MLLKLEDPRFLANLVSVISELVTEVRIKVTKESVSVTAVDPATVAMVYFSIPAELFSQYDVEKDEKLGVNLNDLKNILRRCGTGGSLIIEKDEDNLLRIGIRNRIKRDFTLALIDIESEEKEMPEWEFNSVIKMDSQAFVDAIEDCSVVSDACTFVAEPNKFIIEARGLHSSKIEFSSDEAEIYSDSSISRFSLEYLNKFIKGAKLSSRAEINFSDNHPMRINFPTGKVMLSFVLAPRVEQDD